MLQYEFLPALGPRLHVGGGVVREGRGVHQVAVGSRHVIGVGSEPCRRRHAGRLATEGEARVGDIAAAIAVCVTDGGGAVAGGRL